MECWYKNCGLRKDGCTASCARFSQMLFLFESAELPEALRKPIRLMPDACDVGAFDRLNEIRGMARQFVEGGKNLYICGNVTGNGKTSWSVKIMQNYFNQIWSGNNYHVRGVFLSVPYLLSLQGRGFGDANSVAELSALTAKASVVSLLIMDDVASTDLSKQQQNMLQGIIDHRINSGLSTIYNGNMMGAPLRAAVGQRLYSRIETNSEVVVLKGGDMRGTVANNK